MSAERMNADDSSLPRDAGLSPELEQMAAELSGVTLAPSRVDRDRLFFEAGRASAVETPCECERKLRRERGVWAFVVAASASLALWAPAAYKTNNAIVEHAPASTIATPDATVDPASTPEPSTTSAPVEAESPSELEHNDQPRAAVASLRESRRGAMANFADALWGEPDELPAYVRLRNSVVARGVTIGLPNDRHGSGSSREPIAYSDFWKHGADF